MTTIELPAYGWKPRPMQMPVWLEFGRFLNGDGGRNRFALTWHRRFGKDEIALRMACMSAMVKPASYWHMLPEASQARKAIWDAVNPHTGRKRIDEAFPKEIRKRTRDDMMLIEFVNGATWQVLGSDNYNSLVGSPPYGVVLSEYALADPNAWAFLRPILAENGGWAVFISTPRGRNHFAKLYDYAMTDPTNWFAQRLTVEDTGALSAEMIDKERRELAAERGDSEAAAIIAQEYYCDFNAAMPGAYYAEILSRAEREGRIAPLPWVPGLPVGTAWDIGASDSTAIWFWQEVNGRVRIVNYLEAAGVGLEYYIKKVQSLPYVYADHALPHDAGHQRLGMTVDSISAMLSRQGLRNRVLSRDDDLSVAINNTRQFLATVEITTDPEPLPGETRDDARARMGRGLDAIRQYRRRWSEKNQRYDDKPLHDWCSHAADAVRYLARASERSLSRRAADPSGRMKPRIRIAIGAGE